MEKNVPHCELSIVKAMIQAGKVRITAELPPSVLRYWG